MKNVLLILITFSTFFCCKQNNSTKTATEEKTTFSEWAISYKTHDDIFISGAVTVPDSDNKNLPGIILIHGSAPLDMDESWPAFIDSIPQTYNGKEIKNFKLIAEFLSENGFTVIRVNKRGVKKSLTDVDFDVYKTSSYTNLLKDVHSEIEAFKKETGIDNFILLGWSEGTILATKIAEERDDIKGLILMGVVGSSFKGLMRHFFENEKDFQEAINEIINMPDTVMLGIDRPALLVKELFRDTPNAERIEKLKIPILVLHGEIDVETPVSEAYLVKKAIEKNDNPKSKVIIYKDWGHGFSPHLGEKGEIKTVGPFDIKVLNDIKDWLKINYKSND